MRPGCPDCGHTPTMSQFVFYPKMHRIRCRKCKVELKYEVPKNTKIVFAVVGGLVGILGSVALLVYVGIHSDVFWPAVGAFLIAMFLALSYIEADYVLRRYSPGKPRD